ncbi:MAG: type III pantothenate kinase [Erysipelotrichaceae bacterium]|nr:type III pantothenate kinase [Erysipelotrichaceae bacterium]
MLLTIDAGNTHISMGVFKEDDLIGTFRLTTKTPRTSDEFGLCISSLLKLRNIELAEINDVIISSVVPKIMYSLTNAVRKYLKVEPMIIGPELKTGIEIRTENPKAVGADRIVNAAYVHHIAKKSCLVIDFGTATTYDYISQDGVFEYTVISPGLEITARALSSETAKLPEVEIKKPASILAKNTVSGMQAGIVYGYIGQVEYIVRKMRKELGDFYVIATGGLGRVFEKEAGLIDEYDPDLAYKGMKVIFDMNKGDHE